MVSDEGNLMENRDEIKPAQSEGAMTDLIQRLAEGPGGRELSDEVLLATGWKFHASISPGPENWEDPKGVTGFWRDRPSPTESVDDALALVPEEWTAIRIQSWRKKTMFYVELSKLDDEVNEIDLEARASGENPLPRAICLAVLKAK